MAAISDWTPRSTRIHSFSLANQRSVFVSRDFYIDQLQSSIYLRPARLLVPLVVGVEDTEVTTGGEEVEA